MTKLSLLSKEVLEDLYVKQNMSDVGIAALYGVSDAAISYTRKRFGISTKSQLERLTFGRGGPSLEEVTAVELANLYSSMGSRGIAKYFGVSKTAVLARLHSCGIAMLNKTERATSHEDLTDVQKESIMGSLLGDGHILERGVFKVSHYQEQLGYLTKFYQVLSPHALPIYYEEKELDNGHLSFSFGFRTVQHEWLKVLRAIFYPQEDKIFPVSVISQLTPRSLAYWYFDDGHLDSGLPTLALGNVTESQTGEVAKLLNSRFGLDAYRKGPKGSCEILGIRASSADKFFELIREFTCPDMAYKFPAKHWPKGSVPNIPLKTKETNLLPGSLVREAKEYASLSKEDQESLAEAFVKFWESQGFPYHPIRPEELFTLANLEDYQVIQDGVIKARQVGQAICQGIGKHIWSAHTYDGPSPLELFSNTTTLREVIGFCLKHKGVPNAANLRGALRYWKRSGVYNFRPSAAKALVDQYCPSNGVVLDPCAGYGGRLLGTLLAKAGPSYVGFDPCQESCESLHQLHKWTCSYLPKLEGRFSLDCIPAEEAVFPENVDVVMTSPPYWKREVYSTAPTQSGIRYVDSYEAWLEGFWNPVIAKSIRALKPGGWLILNVDDFSLGGRDYYLIEDTIKIVRGLGLGSPNRLSYDLPGVSSTEAVLCWVKGISKVVEITSSRVDLPRCTSCGGVFALDQLVSGVCKECSKPLDKVPCKGCGKRFVPTRKAHEFHDEACYARYRRKLAREENPYNGVRTFTCQSCLKAWSTTELGHFTLCPECKEIKELEGRVKTCAYRHCTITFTDTSPKNSMSYCCPEHRRREKMFRSGKAPDENYFRANKVRIDPICQSCGERWKPEEGDKAVRCRPCREKARHKVCQVCQGPFVDETLKNTRKFCDACKPVG